MDTLAKVALVLTLADETTKLEQEVEECMPENFEQQAYIRGKYEIINKINNILKKGS